MSRSFHDLLIVLHCNLYCESATETCEYFQILKEFSRLGPSFDSSIEDMFFSGLDSYHGAITTIVKKRKMMPQLKEIIDILPTLRTEDERKCT